MVFVGELTDLPVNQTRFPHGCGDVDKDDKGVFQGLPGIDVVLRYLL